MKIREDDIYRVYDITGKKKKKKKGMVTMIKSDGK